MDELHFLPAALNHTDLIHVRTTHIERTLVSAQRMLTGLYPQDLREVELSVFQRKPPPRTQTHTNSFLPRLSHLAVLWW